MKVIHINCIIFAIGLILIIGCNSNTKSKYQNQKVIPVNSELFQSNKKNVTIKLVDCILSNGSKTKCYEIVTRGIPEDHKVGPFCPEHITSTEEDGGKWYLNEELIDVDGQFIKEMAGNYHNDFWKMYDDKGKVLRTETKEECELISRGQLSDELINHCINCLLSYISEDYTRTFLIPATPERLNTPMEIVDFVPGGNGGPPPGAEGDRPLGPAPGENSERAEGPPPGGGVQARGIAFNGVIFDAPAPIDIIMSGHTIAPLDDAGGHVNPNTGYHYHEATGKTRKINQEDGHEPMIGYAMDGFGIYSHGHYNDLDECLGHYDEIRGYHYHVDHEGSNNFINCFSGAIVNEKED